MKKQFAAALLVACTLLCACAVPEGEELKTVSFEGSDTVPSAQVTQKAAFDSSSYVTLRGDRAASLKISGSNATLVLVGAKDKKTVTGKLTAENGKLTVGSSTFDYAVFDGNILLADGSDVYLLSPSNQTDKAFDAVEMLASSWSSDELKLSFDKMVCTLKKGSATVSESCIVSPGKVTLNTQRVNLAIGAKASATSLDYAELVASNAIDGSTSTRWASGRMDGESITVDLGSIKKISTVRLMWEAASGKDYKIQVSTDGQSWKTVVDVKGNSTVSAFLTYSFEKTDARYVKMLGGTRNTKYGFSLWEFEIYENYAENSGFTFEMSNGKLILTWDGKKYTLEKD